MVKGFVLTMLAATTVAAGAGGTASAAFHGTNGKLAFVKAGDIWAVDPDGSNPVQLTTSPFTDRSPRWAPDGSKIAFSSNRDGDFEIFVMNADGTDPRQVTSNSGAQDRIPSWTGDGAQIVYDKNFSEIFAINANGSGVERKVADGFVPGTSPQGDKLVFTASSTGRLATMHLDGTAFHDLTDGLAANWSPAGNDLVYSNGSPENEDREVYVIDASGTGVTRMTNTPDRFEFGPVWAPDGTQIAFVGCRNFTADLDCEVFAMNRDGTGERQVTALGVSPGEGGVDWQPLPRGDKAGGTAPPQDVVVGSGKTTFPDFPNRGESTTEQFIVSAHSGPNGESPQGQITFHSPVLFSPEARADVTCMIVAGNRARVGGIFRDPIAYFDPSFRFRWFELVVEDSGPAGEGSDMASAVIFLDRPRPPDFSPCGVDLPLFPVDEGNYVVEDAVQEP